MNSDDAADLSQEKTTEEAPDTVHEASDHPANTGKPAKETRWARKKRKAQQREEMADSSTSTADGQSVYYANVTPTSATSIPKIFWALLVVCMVCAGLVGYILGDKYGSAGTSSVQAQGSATANSTGTQPSGVDDETRAMAALATPGTGSLVSTPGANGFDPLIEGPSGPLNTADQIYNIARRNVHDPFAYGAVDAPVVIAEFADFECPYCSSFVNNTEPEIIDKYVDTGLVRLEWNDFPVNGPNAVAGARAGRAAAAQGKFYEFKDTLYAASKDINGHPNFTEDDYISFAQKIGIPDMDKFRSDMASDDIATAVDGALYYGSGLGISGTPGFVVGSTLITGAQDFSAFDQAIQKELAKVGSGEVTVPAARETTPTLSESLGISPEDILNAQQQSQ